MRLRVRTLMIVVAIAGFVTALSAHILDLFLEEEHPFAILWVESKIVLVHLALGVIAYGVGFVIRSVRLKVDADCIGSFAGSARLDQK